MSKVKSPCHPSFDLQYMPVTGRPVCPHCLKQYDESVLKQPERRQR